MTAFHRCAGCWCEETCAQEDRIERLHQVKQRLSRIGQTLSRWTCRAAFGGAAVAVVFNVGRVL